MNQLKINELNNLYFKRQHFNYISKNSLGGFYFAFKNKVDYQKATENGYDTMKYSGLGTIIKCEKCNKNIPMGVIEKHEFLAYKKHNFIVPVEHSRCYEKR